MTTSVTYDPARLTGEQLMRMAVAFERRWNPRDGTPPLEVDNMVVPRSSEYPEEVPCAR